VKALNRTQSSDHNHWPDIILFATYHLALDGTGVAACVTLDGTGVAAFYWLCDTITTKIVI